MIGVLQTAESQKCYHVTRIFETQTKTNGRKRGPKKCACPRTSEMDSKLPQWLRNEWSWYDVRKLDKPYPFFCFVICTNMGKACAIFTKTKTFEDMTLAPHQIKWLLVNEHLHLIQRDCIAV